MSGYLLDTNACIAILKGNPTMLANIRLVGIRQLYLCAPVKAELWLGAGVRLTPLAENCYALGCCHRGRCLNH